MPYGMDKYMLDHADVFGLLDSPFYLCTVLGHSLTLTLVHSGDDNKTTGVARALSIIGKVLTYDRMVRTVPQLCASP